MNSGWHRWLHVCVFFFLIRKLIRQLTEQLKSRIRKKENIEIRTTSNRHRWPQPPSMKPHENSVFHSTTIVFHKTIFPFRCVKVNAYSGIQGRRKYSSNLFATSSLEGDGCSPPRPGRFTPAHNQYAICSRFGGLRGQGWRTWRISPRLKIEPWARSKSLYWIH